jgi:hypothetical protein
MLTVATVTLYDIMLLLRRVLLRVCVRVSVNCMYHVKYYVIAVYMQLK